MVGSKEGLRLVRRACRGSRLKRRSWTVSICCILATLAASIYFPAIADVKRDLNASDQAISLSASLFILLSVVPSRSH